MEQQNQQMEQQNQQMEQQNQQMEQQKQQYPFKIVDVRAWEAKLKYLGKKYNLEKEALRAIKKGMAIEQFTHLMMKRYFFRFRKIDANGEGCLLI